MKLLDETTALDAIRTLLVGADHARLAVAFWGKGAISWLGLHVAFRSVDQIGE